MNENPPGGPGPRREVGDAASSMQHPPHVDVNAQGQPVQASSQHPGDVPTLPANAHGRDHSPVDEQPRSVDDESSYEGRREEHKDN